VSYSGRLGYYGMPLREPQMLYFTQHLVVLLLFCDAAGWAHRGRLTTLSVVRACWDVCAERSTDAVLLKSLKLRDNQC
jgi:hypothetical protein